MVMVIRNVLNICIKYVCITSNTFTCFHAYRYVMHKQENNKKACNIVEHNLTFYCTGRQEKLASDQRTQLKNGVQLNFYSSDCSDTNNSYFLLSVASMYTPCFVMFSVFLYGPFVMVPTNLTCPHCLQHFFFEHLFHLYLLLFRFSFYLYSAYLS